MFLILVKINFMYLLHLIDHIVKGGPCFYMEASRIFEISNMDVLIKVLIFVGGEMRYRLCIWKYSVC